MVEGFQRQKMRNKIISFMIIALLILPYIPIVSVKAADPLEQYKFWKTKHGKAPVDNFRNYLAYEHLEHLKLIMYLMLLGIYTWNITTDLLLNLESYVLLNPSPLDPSVHNVMKFFIFNLQVAFILAIAATALYIVFASGTPKKRANAKSMIGRLVVGMLLVSVSPYIMNLFLDFTSGMTATILNQADSKVAATVYTDLLWQTYWPSVVIIMMPMIGHSIEGWTHHAVTDVIRNNYRVASTADSRRDEIIEGLLSQGFPEAEMADEAGRMMSEQDKIIRQADVSMSSEEKKAAKNMAKGTKWGNFEFFLDNAKVAPRPEQTFAFLMAEMALVFGIYGFLALRYIMLMVWTVLFPVSLFLSSFELTRGIGRNMIEQTIFWSILQIFYAITIDVIAVGFVILPKGFDYFGLGLQFAGINIFFISFFSIAAAILLMLTPILVLMLSQRLTQMDLG
jgi:hypothetical protein